MRVRSAMTKKAVAVWAAGATFLMFGTANGAGASEAHPDEQADVLGDQGDRGEGIQMTIVEDGEWVRYAYEDELPNAVETTMRGERVTSPTDIGCHYSGNETERAGAGAGTVTITREVAQNLEDCTMTLETATVTPAEAGRLGAGPVEDGSEDTQSAGPFTSGASSERTVEAAAAQTKGRYQRLYYNDPCPVPCIAVSGITSRVRWTYTGSAVTDSTHQAHWEWYSPTGWSRRQHWWGHDLVRGSGATTNSTALYGNATFCGPGEWAETFNEYYTNSVTGRPNGDAYYQWDATKWGGCVRLLSFNRATGNWAK